MPVVNYLIFNSGDYLGRILAGMIEWVMNYYLNKKIVYTKIYNILQPKNNPVLIAIMSILRIAFVPALILCNATPRHTFTTLIHSDYIFITLMGLFSFSNGYLANIALICAPK